MTAALRALLLVVIAGEFAANLSHAAVIPPNLPPGYTYQIAFVTEHGIAATSDDIDVYNNFVTTEAAPLAQYLPDGVTWHAVVSTSTVNANVNAPFVLGAFVYNTLGYAVANANYGIYQTQLQAPIDGTQHGPSGTIMYTAVWTGSDYLGNALNTVGSGSSVVTYGDSGSATGNWANAGTASSSVAFSIYGISSPIVVPLTADANGDMIVNGQDVALVASNWLASGSNPADVNHDHIVNGQDIALIASNWLNTGYLPPSGTAATAAIPEPASLFLAVWLALPLLLKRLRKIR